MTPQSVAFYTLGCKLNFSETSAIGRQFEEKGFAKVAFEAGADLYVINTCSVTDHADRKCRKVVQQALKQSPHSGALFAFRGKRGDLVKLLWYDGQGLCLFSKRMDRGWFVWPSTATGSVVMTAAQLSMLLEGIDWRRPERTFVPSLAG